MSDESTHKAQQMMLFMDEVRKAEEQKVADKVARQLQFGDADVSCWCGEFHHRTWKPYSERTHYSMIDIFNFVKGGKYHGTYQPG